MKRLLQLALLKVGALLTLASIILSTHLVTVQFSRPLPIVLAPETLPSTVDDAVVEDLGRRNRQQHEFDGNAVLHANSATTVLVFTLESPKLSGSESTLSVVDDFLSGEQKDAHKNEGIYLDENADVDGGIMDQMTSPNSSSLCFPFNSLDWVEKPRQSRHGNARGDPLLRHDDVHKMLVALPHLLSDLDMSVAFDMLAQSMAHPASPLLNQTVHLNDLNDADAMHRHAVRLAYWALWYHQHAPAVTEAQAYTHHNASFCLARRRRPYHDLGPYDYECPADTTKYLSVSLWDNGIGANIGNVAIPTLLAGVATNRVALLLNKAPTRHGRMRQPWALASCRRRDQQCVLAPMSPCVLHRQSHLDVPNIYSLNKADKQQLMVNGTATSSEQDDAKLWYMLALQKTPSEELGGKVEQRLCDIIFMWLSQLPPTSDRRVVYEAAALLVLHDARQPPREGFDFQHANSIVRQAAQLYILRPLPSPMQRIREVVAHAHQPNGTFDAYHAVGMPIRASDKCDFESECLSFLQSYQAATNAWRRQRAQKTNATTPPIVILTTESQQIMDEFDNESTNLPSLFVTLPRADNATEALIPNTGRFIKKTSPVPADVALLSALTSLYLQLLPATTVANCCSNFHRLLYHFLRAGAGATARHDFSCLQEEPDPALRVCCWKSMHCIQQRQRDAGLLAGSVR